MRVFRLSSVKNVCCFYVVTKVESEMYRLQQLAPFDACKEYLSLQYVMRTEQFVIMRQRIIKDA